MKKKAPETETEADRPAMDRQDLANLTMLADGTLPAGRRAEVEARIAAVPGGTELLDNERRAVTALRAAATVHAPASLRGRIAADRAAIREPRRRRVALGTGLAGALAVLVLALVLVLPGGTPGSPSLSQAASLAVRGPIAPAPPPARDAPAVKLARVVDQVYFPNWARIGWKASGERVDQLGGRRLVTVYYRGYGHLIAYTIVAGPALAPPHGAALTVIHDTELRALGLGGRTVVTWQRDGHTCILSGARLSDQPLLRLAAGETAARS